MMADARGMEFTAGKLTAAQNLDSNFFAADMADETAGPDGMETTAAYAGAANSYGRRSPARATTNAGSEICFPNRSCAPTKQRLKSDGLRREQKAAAA